MQMTRKIVLWACAALGVVLLCLMVGGVVGLSLAWPTLPAVPSGRAAPPPWGSLDAAILEARRRGESEPAFIADATGGPAADGEIHVLVLSSGGQYGAFGAGVLAAWGETGTQPYYDVVTGISAGSILAPIAFLGPSRERALPTLVTEMARVVDKYPVEGRNPIALTKAILGYGFEVSIQIQDLVRKVFDADFVDQVAREHAMGRRLYVSSTDVTAERTVIWDLGAIAASDRPDRVARFQDSVLASFAVPLLFPPIYIESGQPGTYGMHVDGGFRAPFFLASLIEQKEKTGGTFHVDVIVNDKLQWHGRTAPVLPLFFEAAPRLLSIVYDDQMPGAIDSLWLRSELYDFTVRVLAIPDDETLISSLHFSGREIDALFQLGVEIGRKKSAWIRLPRGGISAYWSPLEETTAGAAAGGHSD